MAIKPILFNTPMVQAILDGRKTVTRRVANINTEIPCIGRDNHSFVWDNLVGVGEDKATGFICKHCGFGVSPPHSRYPCGTSAFRPRYWPGDILYVRETWQYAYDADGNDQIIEETGRYLYAADDPAPFNDWIMPDGTHRDTMPWHPSIHMPKEAARIFLHVKSVRLDRLNDMQEEDAVAEGFPDLGVDADSPLERFSVLWDKTIKLEDIPSYGWYVNPWVWVYRLERCKDPLKGDKKERSLSNR